MLKTTVIMKTDIGDFTSQVSKLSSDNLDKMLLKHSRTVKKVIARHRGTIIKGEGDSFWITFESVTDACVAAILIQQSVNESFQDSSNNRSIAIRIALNVGDVLIQDNDIFGDSVNFTARLEQITPVNEIYLSETAYNILNKNEVNAEYVESFEFKGFENKHRIFKIMDIFHSRKVQNQILVMTDIKGFTHFIENESTSTIEKLILNHRRFHEDICMNNGGQIRGREGDSFLLTFEDPDKSIKAIIDFLFHWDSYVFENIESPLHIEICMHIGTFLIFDSVILGEDINTVGAIASLGHTDPGSPSSTISISESLYTSLNNSNYKKRCKQVLDENGKTVSIRNQKVYRLSYR
ncbi:MAG: hypothetical protein JEY99_20885 [Spirochaetales bacterium]|nr:hypothetical protein [Spirochaetales bacterium]